MSLNNRNIRKLLNSKAITFGDGIPVPSEGQEGDITVRKVPRGARLFIKAHGKWWTVPMYYDFKTDDDLKRLVSNQTAKYVGEIGFSKQSSEFEFKQSPVDSIKYAGATTKIERNVNDGNPTFQIGSSDTECFKISCDYKGGEKGLMTTTFSTLTAGGDANAGKMFFSVGGTRRLEINDSDLTIMGFGSATADTEALIIENDVSAASMDDTRTSIAFYQEAYNASGADALADSAKITVGTIGNWTTADSGTHDAYMSFSSVLNGTMNTTIKAYGNGQTSFCEAGNEYVKILPHSTDSEIDITGNFVLDATGDIELNADGGQVNINDGADACFVFDMDGPRFRILDDANSADHFTIDVGAEGTTLLATVDANTAVAHIELRPDGQLKLTPEGTQNQGVYIDFNTAHTTDKTCSSLFIDTDQTGIIASGQTLDITNIDNRLNTNSPTMVGTVNAYGIKNLVACGTSGTQTAYGIYNSVTGADTNIGIYSVVDDGAGVDIKCTSSATSADYFTIHTQEHGETILETVDGSGEAADLKLDPDGKLILTPSEDLEINGALGNTVKSTLPIKIKEIPAAYTDSSTYGQIWVKNSSPNELYYTTGDGDDIQITSGTSLAGGGGGGDYYIHNSARCRTQYNNWYYGANTAYGFNYYYWVSTTSSTAIPSVYVDSLVPGYIVPKNGTVKAYTIIGNITTTDTWEWILMKGAQPTYGSAGNYTLSQVGSTQSAGGTANILYKWEETGLSVAVNAGDMVIPYFRRTTDNDASYSYAEISMVITLG